MALAHGETHVAVLAFFLGCRRSYTATRYRSPRELSGDRGAPRVESEKSRQYVSSKYHGSGTEPAFHSSTPPPTDSITPALLGAFVAAFEAGDDGGRCSRRARAPGAPRDGAAATVATCRHALIHPLAPQEARSRRICLRLERAYLPRSEKNRRGRHRLHVFSVSRSLVSRSPSSAWLHRHHHVDCLWLWRRATTRNTTIRTTSTTELRRARPVAASTTRAHCDDLVFLKRGSQR